MSTQMSPMPPNPTPSKPTPPKPPQQSLTKSFSLTNQNTTLKILIVPALSWTLGSSLKSIVDSTVFDLIEPAVFMLIHILDLHKINHIRNLIPKQERTFRISHFLSALLSFVFIVYLVLALFNYYY